jgi:eukaryotic-like serine/threonine-protein kinase
MEQERQRLPAVFDRSMGVVDLDMSTISSGSQVGPYRVSDLIAKGGMGEVYQAHDTRLNRKVALKVLAPRFSTDTERMARFAMEARTTALLNHPNILSVYDVGSHLGVPFVVSELLEGKTLRARLKEGALPVDTAVDYALEIARGLVAAHLLNVVHRDLKPENVFITRDGRVKILDFGLAKCREDSLALPSNESSISTDPGTLLGTVGYVSPELVRGIATDQRADIFSLGIMLHEMITGVAPFQRESAVETLHAILKEEPIALCEHDRRVPAPLDQIVRHCLEKDRDARFQSAHDLVFSIDLVRRWLDQNRRLQPHPLSRRLATLFRMW